MQRNIIDLTGNYAYLRYYEHVGSETWAVAKKPDDRMVVLELNEKKVFESEIQFYELGWGFTGDVFDIEGRRYIVFQYPLGPGPRQGIKLTDKVTVFDYGKGRLRELFLEDPGKEELQELAPTN